MAVLKSIFSILFKSHKIIKRVSGYVVRATLALISTTTMLMGSFFMYCGLFKEVYNVANFTHEIAVRALTIGVGIAVVVLGIILCRYWIPKRILNKIISDWNDAKKEMGAE